MNYIRLSKIISYALRHAPLDFNLSVSKEGWVSIAELVEGIKRVEPDLNELRIEDIYEAIYTQKKIRHEISSERIRALYGHSIQINSNNNFAVPPVHLFHGTAIEKIDWIRSEGIKKMSRQFVHLSEDEQEATIVGKRKSSNVIVLKINSRLADKEGINFRHRGSIWLCEYIPAKYIINLQA